MTLRRRDRAEEEGTEAVVAAFMEVAVAFTAAEEDSVVVDFTVAVSMAVACGWVVGDLSAHGPASPVHFQGPPIEAEAGHMPTAEMRGAARA